jgi:hypothetical protein
MAIEYCPTKEMIGDFTKPLQGALFYKLRARVLNLSPDGVLPVSSTFASPQECVGDEVGDYRLPACTIRSLLRQRPLLDARAQTIDVTYLIYSRSLTSFNKRYVSCFVHSS